MATADLIKELREKTGAGFMNCKKALDESSDNLENAIAWLRKKGLAVAAKKSDRITSEGVISVLTSDTEGVMLEVNSETDFVSRNDKFREFIKSITELAFNNKINSLGSLKTTDFNGSTIGDALMNLIAIIGENINIRRMERVSVANGVISHYIHSSEFPGMGKIGVLVKLESSFSDKTSLFDLGKRIAMHIAASNPLYLNIESVPDDVLAREKDIIREKALGKAKNDVVLNKMIDGGVKKYFKEIVLLEQTFVITGECTIQEMLSEFEKQNNCSVKIGSFCKFVLGEGIEKIQSNFAEEVMSQIK